MAKAATDDMTAGEVDNLQDEMKVSPADAEAVTESGDSDDVDQDDAEAEEDPNPNAEAAKYRHKLRDEKAAHQETRAALEAATARVEALQRQQIESLIATANVKPAAVWAVSELAALLGDDGTVSVDAVNAAIDTARKTLGIPHSKGVHVPGLADKPLGLPKVDGWTEAFKPKRK